MPLRFEPLALDGLCLIHPEVSGDAQARFTYHYQAGDFAAAGLPTQFVQEHASRYGPVHTVRGLHFQRPPHAQHKLVRVARGRILDVVVDVRRGSPTWGRHVSVPLDADGWRQLLVPPGFAHGFCTLEPDTEVVFRLTVPNQREHLGGLLWNDPALGITWPCGDEPGMLLPVDARWPALRELDSPFAVPA